MIKGYFYNLNYPRYEEELCNMEMKYLFGHVPRNKYIISMEDVTPERSPFIKDRIKILYEENSLKEIIEKIVRFKISYEDFKVIYVKCEGYKIDYGESLEIVKAIGSSIVGIAEMHNPSKVLGITKINEKWIFGEYEKNNCQWHKHNSKPKSYSNSIGVRLSRALINIAVGNNLNLRLIDPCCGVGTVVIDALSMGINIKGVEINKQIARNAKINLEFFGYENVIITGDMKNINEQYDVAIIDLPYGVFTSTTLEEQEAIISWSRKIAKKLILLTFENMDKSIEKAGFKIMDKCSLAKGNFVRYINVCE